MRVLIVALALLFGGMNTTPSYAKCNINLKIKNIGKKDGLSVVAYRSEVRVKGGTWKKLSKLGWGIARVNPGKTKSDVLEAKLKCTAKRRYMIRYECHSSDNGGNRVTYYPSSSGYTTKTSVTINLSGCD